MINKHDLCYRENLWCKNKESKYIEILITVAVALCAIRNDIVLKGPFCLSRPKYDSRVFVVFSVFAYFDCPSGLWYACIGGNVVYITHVARVIIAVIDRKKITTCIYQRDWTSGRLSRLSPVHTTQLALRATGAIIRRKNKSSYDNNNRNDNGTIFYIVVDEVIWRRKDLSSAPDNPSQVVWMSFRVWERKGKRITFINEPRVSG